MIAGKDIEKIYQLGLPRKAWWGQFASSWELVEKDFPFSTDISRLLPVCARIALHVTGEFPRILFSKERPVSVVYDSIRLWPELLYLQVEKAIRIPVFLGHFIRELGHVAYTAHHYEAYKLPFKQLFFVQMLEARRVEAKLLRSYPGYYDYLYAARNLGMSVALLKADTDLKFNDLDDVRFHYFSIKVLYPELLEEAVFQRQFGPHLSRMTQVDCILEEIGDYGDLEVRDVVELSRRLYRLPWKNPDRSGQNPLFNYYSDAVKNLPLDTEDTEIGIDLKMTDDLFQDLSNTFEEGKSTGSDNDFRPGMGSRARSREVEEKEAEEKEADPLLEAEARKLANRIKLHFRTFTARMNRTAVLYEQDEGELDEEELYLVALKPEVFMEEVPAPSAMLELIVLLDLSASMSEGKKLSDQIVLSLALALAFDKNPEIRYAVYGHRVNWDNPEIITYHRAGERLKPGRFFAQEARLMNADGFAIEYCLKKFTPGIKNKILIVISDGRPTITYDERPPRAYVREMVRYARRQGIEVLSIGLSDFEQGDMYDEFIPYSESEIAVRLMQWLKRKFNFISEGAFF